MFTSCCFPIRRRLVAVVLAGLLWCLPAMGSAAPPVRAPELDGGAGWIGSDKPLRLQDFRGKFVILDFWTLC